MFSLPPCPFHRQPLSPPLRVHFQSNFISFSVTFFLPFLNFYSLPALLRKRVGKDYNAESFLSRYNTLSWTKQETEVSRSPHDVHSLKGEDYSSSAEGWLHLQPNSTLPPTGKPRAAVLPLSTGYLTFLNYISL